MAPASAAASAALKRSFWFNIDHPQGLIQGPCPGDQGPCGLLRSLAAVYNSAASTVLMSGQMSLALAM